MALVYEAHDQRHDRTVAVKILRPEVAATIGTERFLQEIRITAQLQHPHTLTLIDSGEVDGLPFYVMPFVDGPSLRRRMESEPRMPVRAAAALLRDIADALAAAHDMGIVHRDVKPENVLLSGHHVWVADFGVAHALWDAVGTRTTSAGTVVGTPAYMAPEQATPGEPIDRRTDIYALGVVAYEMLSGQTPIRGETPRAVLTGHILEHPHPLQELRCDLPDDLAAAVMRCLEKAPEDRWQDARELSEHLNVHAVGGTLS